MFCSSHEFQCIPLKHSKILRTSEQRHKKVLNNLKMAETKAAQLCQQQSETRKKLFSLYASLQSALASSTDETAKRACRKKSDDTSTHRSETRVSDLSWWRISILDVFHVGNMADYSRHSMLKMEVAITLVDVGSSLRSDIVTPICQHHLLGTCLDDKCVLRHPSSSEELHLKSSGETSRGMHFSWILKRHRQHLSKERGTKECDDHVDSFKLQYPLSGSSDKKCVDFFNKHLHSDCLAISSQDQLSKKKESAGRYFDVTNTNQVSSIDDSSTATFIAESGCDSNQWKNCFMDEATIAMGHLGLEVDLCTPPSTTSFSSSSTSSSASNHTLNLSDQRISLGHFIFHLLYGCSYRNEVQRDLCILSCMHILKSLIDSCHSIVSKTGWRIYLILCLESNIINLNPALLFWPKMIQHLERSYVGSRSMVQLIAAGRCKLKDLNQEHRSICPARNDLTRMCMPDVIESVRTLERLCSEGRGEVAVDLLSAHLDLEPFFSTNRPDGIALVDRCMPIDLAYAMLFNVLFTGGPYGRKVLYCRNILFVEKQISSSTVKRVKNLVRRCPHILIRLRNAFDLYFTAVWHGRNILSTSDTERSDKSSGHVILTIVDQNILWSYLILISCSSGEDITLMPMKFSDVLAYCDPLCYPGVYEGIGIEEYARQGISDPSSSMRVDLLVALNAYLSCKEKSYEPLVAAVQHASEYLLENAARNITSASAGSDVNDAYLSIAQEAVCESWTSYLGADDLIQCRIILEVSKWTIRICESPLEYDEINHLLHRWTEAFVSRCDAQSLRLKMGFKRIDSTIPGHNIVFLNILFFQVLAAAKAACIFSTSHSTCVYVLDMVSSVLRASQRLNDPFGDCFDATGHSASIDDSVKDIVDDGFDNDLHCCVSETDCATPSWQHRLLERTLDLLRHFNMMTYDIVEYLFSKSMIHIGGLNMLVNWVLHWFNAREAPKDKLALWDCKKWARRNLDPMFRPSLRSSALISNVFSNNKYLSSKAFLSRITSSTLFELSLHFLNAESFELYSTVQGLLDLEPSFAVLLRSYTVLDELIHSVQLHHSKDSITASSSSCSSSSGGSSSGANNNMYLLVEDLNDDDAVTSDSMLQRFQENLNDCNSNNKTVIDLSSLVPHQMSGLFPFQSLALFSSNILELDLSNNFLKCFPSALLFFSRIRKLIISGNQIERLPSQFSLLAHLRTLDLGSNKLTAFPPCLLEMTFLEVLVLCSNSIEYVPTQVKSLQKLRHLDISLNPLKVLCSDLTHIQFLKTI